MVASPFIALSLFATTTIIASSDTTDIVSLRARTVDFSSIQDGQPGGLAKILAQANRANFVQYRNAIYARHGYLFKTKELRDYFKSKPWYKGDSADQKVVSGRLSKLEIRNVEWLEANEFVETDPSEPVCMPDGSLHGHQRISSLTLGVYRFSVQSNNERFVKTIEGPGGGDVYSGTYTLSVSALKNHGQPASVVDLGVLNWQDQAIQLVEFDGAILFIVWEEASEIDNPAGTDYIVVDGKISRLTLQGGSHDNIPGRLKRGSNEFPAIFRGQLWTSYRDDQGPKASGNHYVESWQVDVPKRTLRLTSRSKIW